MTKKIITVLTLAIVSTISFGSYKQKITMCLDASADKDFVFTGHFESTDHFDKGHNTATQPLGRNCTSHTYKTGPKNISFKLEIQDKDTLLAPNASCGFLYNKSNSAQLIGDPQRVTGKYESWVFTLIPNSPVGQYKHVYLLDCLNSSV